MIISISGGFGGRGGGGGFNRGGGGGRGKNLFETDFKHLELLSVLTPIKKYYLSNFRWWRRRKTMVNESSLNSGHQPIFFETIL